MKRAVALVFFFVACHAPPSAGRDAAAGAPSACAQFGAPCTFAPGKLGTCVEVEHPGQPSSFVCQSQH